MDLGGGVVEVYFDALDVLFAGEVARAGHQVGDHDAHAVFSESGHGSGGVLASRLRSRSTVLMPVPWTAGREKICIFCKSLKTVDLRDAGR